MKSLSEHLLHVIEQTRGLDRQDIQRRIAELERDLTDDQLRVRIAELQRDLTIAESEHACEWRVRCGELEMERDKARNLLRDVAKSEVERVHKEPCGSYYVVCRIGWLVWERLYEWRKL